MLLQPVEEGVVDAALPAAAGGLEGRDDLRRETDLHRLFRRVGDRPAPFGQNLNQFFRQDLGGWF